MNETINAKTLRANLPKVVARVRKGGRFTVLYGGRPAFQIVPVRALDEAEGPVEADSLLLAGAVGRSTDGRDAADHDAVLYPRPRR